MCTQVMIGGSGSGTPNPTVSFPGAYSDSDPGIYDPSVCLPAKPFPVAPQLTLPPDLRPWIKLHLPRRTCRQPCRNRRLHVCSVHRPNRLPVRHRRFCSPSADGRRSKPARRRLSLAGLRFWQRALGRSSTVRRSYRGQYGKYMQPQGQDRLELFPETPLQAFPSTRDAAHVALISLSARLLFVRLAGARRLTYIHGLSLSTPAGSVQVDSKLGGAPHDVDRKAAGAIWLLRDMPPLRASLWGGPG